MQDVSAWLDEMAQASLPGGIAAAALAGAMGAALLAKAARVALRRSGTAGGTVTTLSTIVTRARVQQRVLLRLCDADTKAYSAVIAGEGQAAWQAAVEVSLQVAEAAASVRPDVPAVRCHASPAVAVDLDVADRLLAVTHFAGQLAARENLGHVNSGAVADALTVRLASLAQEVEA